MGLFDIFSRHAKLAAFNAGPASIGVVSPFQTSTLANIAWAEHFNGELGELTRNGAMQLPAVARARGILVGIIASLPLREFEGNADIEQAWLYRTSGQVSPWHRLAWTIDDLLFHGWALWAVEREGNQITDAARVPFEQWAIDAKGRVLVNGKSVKADEIVLIPGPFEGILAAGGPTIKGARALERAWVGRAQNPIPLTVIQEVSRDDQLDDDEIDEIIEKYAAARTSPTGSVAWSDHRTKIEALGTVSTDLFVEGRNANVLDFARLTGIPAALLDGSMSTATLTYSTQEGKRSEFLDFSLSYWTAPIEARLSMDDVCAPGRRIRFDKTELTVTENSPVAAPVED